MKFSKRILTVLLAFLMIAGSLAMMFIFTGCDGTTNGDDDVDIDEINFLVNAADGDFVFDEGLGFCINYRSIAVPEEVDRLGVVNAAVIARNTQIYDELGVTVNMRTRTSAIGNMSDYLAPLFATGFNDYHVISGHQWFSIGKIFGTGSGRFINFNALTASENALQLDQPWWDSNRIDALTHNGASWYITGHLSQAWIAGVYISAINRTMWEDHSAAIANLTGGLTCIYDIVRAGLWTIDLVIAISNSIFTSVTGADTARRGDTVGYLSMAGGNSWPGYAMAVGAAVPFTVMEGGRPQVGVQGARAVDFANRLNTLYFDTPTYIADVGVREMLEIFREGDALMTITMLMNVEIHLADEGFDYGIHVAPVPKLNAEQANHYSLVHDLVALFAIPVDHFGIISDLTRVLDRLAELSYTIVYPAFYQTAIMRMIIGGDHTDTSEMLQIARDGVQACFVLVWINEVGGVGLGFLFRGGSPNYVANVRGQIANWNRNIATLLSRLDEAVTASNLEMARARQVHGA